MLQVKELVVQLQHSERDIVDLNKQAMDTTKLKEKYNEEEKDQPLQSAVCHVQMAKSCEGTNLDSSVTSQDDGISKEAASLKDESCLDKLPLENHFLFKTFEEQMNNPGTEGTVLYTSYRLKHILSSEECVQDSLHILEESKPKMKRGPYKKMLKVNFDPDGNPGKPYFCDECGRRFKLRDSLRAHQKQGHSEERPWGCEQCGASFKKKGTLTAHLDIHRGIRPFKCESCPASFRRQTELNIHCIKHSNIKPYECTLCRAAFAWKNSLKHHMKTHSSEKPYQCEVCKATFKWPDSLKLHMNTHSSVKEFGCDECKARFKWKRSLRVHKLTHSSIKPFVCDLCGSQFVQRAKLKLHMVVHTADKPFKCELCKMAFARKDRLKSHMKVHSVEKPHVCDICRAVFRWDYGLKKHRLIHEKAESQPCKQCGETFMYIREAKKHVKVHTVPNTLRCKECSMTFRCKKEYNKHNRCVHKPSSKEALHKNKIKQRKHTWQGLQISDEPVLICIEPCVEDIMQETDDEQEILDDGASNAVQDKEDKSSVQSEEYGNGENHCRNVKEKAF